MLLSSLHRFFQVETILQHETKLLEKKGVPVSTKMLPKERRQLQLPALDEEWASILSEERKKLDKQVR